MLQAYHAMKRVRLLIDSSQIFLVLVNFVVSIVSLYFQVLGLTLSISLLFLCLSAS